MAILSGIMLMSKFSGIGSMLLKNWKLVIIVLLVAGIGYYHWDRSKTIANLREDVATLEQNIAACKGAVNSQNTIIDKAATTSAAVLAKEKENTKAAILAEQKKTKAAIAALQNKEIATTCEGAIEELIGSARGDLKWPE